MKQDGVYVERYISDSPTDTNTYTVNQILTRHFNKLWKANRMQISCPGIFYELSLSIRLKILKIVEKHYFTPPPLADSKLVSFFDHYNDYPTEDATTIREYRACLMACQEEKEAASLLLQCGFDYKRVNNISVCTKASLVNVTYNDKGIILHFDYPTTDLQAAYEATCANILNDFQILANRLYDKKEITQEQRLIMKSNAIIQFFSQNSHTYSLPKPITKSVISNFDNYISKLYNTRDPNLASVKPGTIISDYEWLKIPGMTARGVTITLPYEDFILSERTIAQQIQNQEMRENRVLDTMGEKYAAHPEWTSTTPFSVTQTREFFSASTISAALKYGYITRPKRGVYYYNFIDTWNKMQECAFKLDTPDDESDDEPLIF